MKHKTCGLLVATLSLSMCTFAALYDSDNFSSSTAWKNRFADTSTGNVTWGSSGGQSGAKLKILIKKGQHTGSGMEWRFSEHGLSDKTKLFGRYYCKYWYSMTEYTGKAPGFRATASGGWGNKPSTGSNGWSARGSLHAQGRGDVLNRYYVYHVNQGQSFGDTWAWSGAMNHSTWYKVEQKCVVNDPSSSNGKLKAWVNGSVKYNKTNIRFRTTSANNIKAYWINYYHGGSETAPQDSNISFDEWRVGSTRTY